MKKYEFTGEPEVILGHTLHRIRALVDIERFDVNDGDLGGWIEKDENLSQDGNAWVSGEALVFDNARVSGNAWVSDNARVSGNAWVSDNARVSGNALVSGNARVFSDAVVSRTSHSMTVGPIGSRDDFTTFTRDKDGVIHAVCGCFYGNIEKFLKKVEQTHGDSKNARVYRAAVQLALEQIDTELIEDFEK